VVRANMTSIDSFINTSILTNNAKLLFSDLLNSPELADFTLVGGTALALQIRHRISLDFDFACYQQKLPVNKIDNLIIRLKNNAYSIHTSSDVTKVAQFKINTGTNLYNYARDYIINGIKLTFFVHGKTNQQREFYNNCEAIQDNNKQFKILSIEGLMVSKILLLADRARSRDLFDLMILFKDYSLTLEKLELFVKTLGHNDDPEHYRAVLTGIIPLDKNDEGLKSVNVDFDINKIYQFFDELYAQQDIKKASEFYSNNEY